MVDLYQLFRRFVEGTDGPSFPCRLADLRQDRGLLAALRAQLPMIDNLITLITDPPAILMDERQGLCFFKGFSLPLRPLSFRYLFLLAQSPGEFVKRAAIYAQLWPGEMNFAGTDKPYEQQITDHKYHLTAEIRKGMAGRLTLKKGEIEGMISTRYAQGYRLNLPSEEVLVFTRKDLLIFAFLFLLRKWFDGFTGWLPFWRCLGSFGVWPGQPSL
ncbi:MAG: helix-turn-helix domain-containing protein [Deltaproteobacteria bacterium]|nr:helix-turn-helix domain-containing protein [Deltaproteobacteria bacterium]